MGVFSKIPCNRIFSEESRRPKFRLPFLPELVQTHISNEFTLISEILSREVIKWKPEYFICRINSEKQGLQC